MINWREHPMFALRIKPTAEQEIYLDSIFSKQLTIVDATAGTGKTLLALAAARILQKDVIYTFSPVEEDKLGFRPGTAWEKIQDYLGPLKDALLEIDEIPDQAIFNPTPDTPKHENSRAWVHAMPHTFLRGTNIKGKVLIVEEAQNFTRHELKKTLTRAHDNTTVIVIGHMGQMDLPEGVESGLPRAIEVYKDEPYAQQVSLTINFRGRLSRQADKM